MVFSLAQVQTSCQLWVLRPYWAAERRGGGEERSPVLTLLATRSLHRGVGVPWVLRHRQSRGPLAYWLSLSLSHQDHQVVRTYSKV